MTNKIERVKVLEEIDEFEYAWNKFWNDKLYDYNKRHKTRIGRWFGRPYIYNKNSVEYESTKAIANLFFQMGILLTLKNRIKKIR